LRLPYQYVRQLLPIDISRLYNRDSSEKGSRRKEFVLNLALPPEKCSLAELIIY
jgi:hypothetical protein